MESLGPGMTYDASGGYHVVVADLDSDATEVRVSAPHGTPNGDQLTTQTHAREEGATVAVNANYFGGGPNYPCGLVRGFGMTYSDGYGEAVNCVTSLGWAHGKGQIFDSGGHEHDTGFMTQYTDVATGGGYLLSGGQPRDWNHAKLEEGRDCTAVGISADRKHFIFVVTDATACTGAGLQAALQSHGAADAIHLDGGGSSKMWIRGKGYVNNEVEDRAPPNVILARPNGECPADCGGALCAQLDRPFRAQCVGQACRAGMNGIWNCDTAKVRRVHCDANGIVVSEHCGQSCQPMPVGQDDVCVGGVVPEPPPDAGPKPHADAGPGAPDASVPPGRADAGAPGGSATPPPASPSGDGPSSGGCGTTGRSSPSTPLTLAILALLAALARRR